MWGQENALNSSPEALAKVAEGMTTGKPPCAQESAAIQLPDIPTSGDTGGADGDVPQAWGHGLPNQNAALVPTLRQVGRSRGDLTSDRPSLSPSEEREGLRGSVTTPRSHSSPSSMAARRPSQGTSSAH